MTQPAYASDIPNTASERVIRLYANGRPEISEYWLNGIKVGRRVFDEAGGLIREQPYLDGMLHGTTYQWDSGSLILRVPYVEGLPHGVAIQYSFAGHELGRYELSHGDGPDVWWQEDQNGRYLAELGFLKDGKLEGPYWWINPDQESVHLERFHQAGKLHGIERIWGNQPLAQEIGFFVSDSRVSKAEYARACEHDPSLVVYREADNLSQRSFPAEVQGFLRVS